MAGQANIWVDTNGGSCTRSAVPAAYADATACGSLDAANDICRGGDTVLIRGGTYPQSDITGSGVGRSASSRCTFDVPDGQTAVIGCLNTTNGDGATVAGASCLDVAGSYLVFRHLEAQHYVYSGWTYYGRFDTERGAGYITFERNHMGALANGAAHVDVLHNELGPGMDPFNSLQIDGGNTTWDSNYIHDVRRMSAGHIECLVWEDTNDGNRLVNNLFKNCAIFDVGIMPPENPGTSLIDHNVFWEPFYVPDGNNANVWINTHGATSCPITVSNNWFGDGLSGTEGFYANCNGVIDGGGNTYHDPSVQPPDPRQN